MADELALDHCFWREVSGSERFRAWLLGRTKFGGRDLEFVTDEKWHQRWYQDPETGEQSETDVLLLFKDNANGQRYALHIENKPAHGKWQPNQPQNYRKRAINRMGPIGYVDFQTVLLAPLHFSARHAADLVHFDVVISYEDVGAFVPEFAAAVAESLRDA